MNNSVLVKEEAVVDGHLFVSYPGESNYSNFYFIVTTKGIKFEGNPDLNFSDLITVNLSPMERILKLTTSLGTIKCVSPIAEMIEDLHKYISQRHKDIHLKT